MAKFARWNAALLDTAGNKVDGASIDVRLAAPGLPFAAIYSDRGGATPLTNPFTAADGGNIGFFAAGGAYMVTATWEVGGIEYEKVWEYVAIGLGAETDSEQSPARRTVIAAGDITVTAADRIILVKKTVGAATAVYLDKSALRGGFDLVIKDAKRDSSSNPITIHADDDGPEDIDGSATLVIDSDGHSFRLSPREDGTGWDVIA